MFRCTVRNMLGNATSQDVMNFRTVIEGRNSNHVDQSRDFKVLQTPQPVPAKSQKRWNIGKINTYTAYTYSYYVLTWLILEWNKKLNWDRCKISHFLKQPSGGFLNFFFFATDTTSANIYALWDGRSRSWNSFTLFSFQCKLSFHGFQESQKNMSPV